MSDQKAPENCTGIRIFLKRWLGKSAFFFREKFRKFISHQSVCIHLFVVSSRLDFRINLAIDARSAENRCRSIFTNTSLQRAKVQLCLWHRNKYVSTSMLYFSRAAPRSKKKGIQGSSTPRKQHKNPLLSRYPAFLHIKHGPHTAPQQPTYINNLLGVWTCSFENLHVSRSFVHPKRL